MPNISRTKYSTVPYNEMIKNKTFILKLIMVLDDGSTAKLDDTLTFPQLDLVMESTVSVNLIFKETYASVHLSAPDRCVMEVFSSTSVLPL